MQGEFRLGEWRVEPHLNRLVHTGLPGHEVRVDPKAMQVLVYMADHAGEVVRKKKVVDAIWEGSTSTDEVLTNSIWELRKAVGDDAKSPRYIQTIPRKGYRLVANVVPDVHRAGEEGGEGKPRFGSKTWVALAVMSLFAAVLLYLQLGIRPQPPVLLNTVAVFPFAYRGSEEFSYMSEGMAGLLSAEMDATGDLISVDPHALLNLVRSKSGPVEDPERAGRIARRFGAGLFLLGDVVEVGGRLHLRALLYSVDRDSGPVARVSLQGHVEELFQLAEQLTTQVLAVRSKGT